MHISEQWQAMLDNDDLESEILVEDFAVAGRSSARPHTNAAIGHELSAYSVWVPTVDRDDAEQALSDTGRDGSCGQRDNTSSTSFALRGARFALAARTALLMLRLARA
jgi:hypothetical protein